MNLPRVRKFKTKDSSMLSKIYFASTFTKTWLFAEFNNGSVYGYDSVPFSTYKSLRKINRVNGSVGSNFHDLVKSKDYKYTRVI